MPTIISNYANDIIEYKNNLIVEWWPALYIEKYYKQNSIDYNLISWWNKWEVFISNNNWDDVWLIKYAPVINIKDNYFIISTLLNEFDLTNNLVTEFIKNLWTIIITTGSKWIIKLINDKWKNIIKVPVWNFKDTIWAWDTFLASFADNYFKFNDIEKSILKSSKYVYNFLRDKNNI